MAGGHSVLGGVVGGLFVAHGAQKLFGAFGGGGVEGTAQVFEQIGIRPGKRNAILAGAAETGGGALLALGKATPLAAAALTGTMATAIWKVHKDKGLWNTNQGYEFPLVMTASVFAVTAERDGFGTAVAALAAGVGGAAAILAMAEREAGGEPPQQQQAAPQPQQQEPASGNGQRAAQFEPASP